MGISRGSTINLIKKGVLIFLLFISSSAFAKTVVLVHGFLSDGRYWRTSGFTLPLVQSGYLDGGNYTLVHGEC